MGLDERPAGVAGGVQRSRWRHIAAGMGWVSLCTALGTALMVLPWAWVWERNYLVTHLGGWADVWLNPYLRGAVTGLGVVNVGISFLELLRLWRWWPPWRDGRS